MKLTQSMPSILTFLFCAFALSANAVPTETAHATGIVGTWRWISVDGRQTDHPFYARYYADGKAATWPAPKGWSDWKGVSHGRYTLSKGYLTIDSTSGQHGPKARLQLQKDGYTLTTDEGHKLLYRRVVPSLEPGRLEK